jgi:hypothetical protein
MQKAKLILLFVLACSPIFAQQRKSAKLPLAAEKWTFAPEKV